MERGDTGLGRDAYGPPRRERDRRASDPGLYPPDEGYQAEEDDAAGPGRRPEAEDGDYGQLLRRPGDMPPRQPRIRQPGRPHSGQQGRFSPGAPPNGSPGHGGMPGGGIPGGMPAGGTQASGMPGFMAALKETDVLKTGHFEIESRECRYPRFVGDDHHRLHGIADRCSDARPYGPHSLGYVALAIDHAGTQVDDLQRTGV